ncbi:MAG: hypothetical protein HIU88_05030 [Acidobacteria bacterium]|nr:hypothetical protein [Acidobacteriota bacterium]
MGDTPDVLGPATPDREGASRSSLVVLIVLTVVFAVLYAYPLFQGISNFVALPPYYRQLGIGGAVPWYLLVIGVLAPPVLYVGALLLGRGREIFARALILAVGLAATNALALSVVQWAQAVQPAIK